MQTSWLDKARPLLARVAVGVAALGLTAAAVASDAAEVAGGAGGDSPLGALHLDVKMIFAQAVTFLVAFIILWKAVFSRVGSVLDKRRTDITTRMSKIEEDQAEAARVRAETEERLAEIGREAQARYETATTEGEEQRERIVAEAREAAQAEIDRAQETIGREKAAAIIELRSEVAGLVVQATRQILGESLDEARQRQIVDDMIERLPTE
jgi:F-type H+-transporting ATPase subunit b